MAKQFFKNLPDTSTPLTATRFNGLLDGDESQGNLVVDSIKSKNLFDKNTIMLGWLNNVGTIVSSTSYFVTDFIKVIPGEKYTYQGTTIDTDYGAKIGYYDTDKVWVSYADIVSGGTTITIPNNIYYLRTTIRTSELHTYQIEKGTTATTYISHQNLNMNEYTLTSDKRITDFDTVTNPGTYQFINTTSNIPSGLDSPYGNLIVAKTTVGSAIYIHQIAIDNKGNMVERSWYPSTNSWRPWVNVAIDTDWVTPTLTSNFAAYGNDSNNVPRYRKINNIVNFRGSVTPTASLASNTEQTICTLPVGYRPAFEVKAVCQGSGMNRWLLGISKNGTVTLSRYGVSTQDNVPAGAWLPFGVTYFTD